jgi:branched-subunit amino acid ABC-type transport system permease component
MTLILEQVANGLGLTGPILLVAVALSTSVAAVRVLNVAVGSIYVIAGMLAIAAAGHAGLVGFLAVGIGLPIVTTAALELGVFRWQRRRATEVELGSFAATLGAATVIAALASYYSSGEDIALPADFLRLQRVVEVAGVSVDLLALGIFGVAVAATGAWSFFLYHLRVGKLYRAHASDRFLARSIGARVDRIALQSAGVTGLLLGLATCLFLVRVRAVGPESATAFLLTPFAAVVAGGMGSLAGTVVASLFFGLAQSLVSTYSSTPGVQDIVVFGILFVALIVRPSGLVPVRSAERHF